MNLLNMLSAKKFTDWINKARKGDKMTYYRGFLFAPNMQKYSPTQDFRRVNNMRSSIYKAYEHNLVTLVQKKHDDFGGGRNPTRRIASAHSSRAQPHSMRG